MERFRTTLSIRFYCRKSKIGNDGQSPVELGINCNGERFFCNLPRRCSPVAFEREINSRKSNPLKEYLNAIEGNLRAFETKCLFKGKRLSPVEIKQYIRNGFQAPTENLGYLIDKFYEYVDKKDILQGVKNKYRVVVNQFLACSGLKAEDSIDRITKGVCRDFIDYLQRNYKNSTMAGMLQRFKCLMNYAADNNLIEKSPLTGIKIKRQEVEVVALTEEEVERIIKKDLTHLPRLEKVRDLFIFSCFTGLAYVDTQRLKPADIQREDETYYINKERAKTGVKYMVVLLPEALDILKKYDWNLPKLSNQRVNSYLSEIEAICGINKRLHFHLARHTAACMFLNKYGFKAEITAKILGHSLEMTKHYQKVFDRTIFNSFAEIKKGV